MICHELLFLMLIIYSEIQCFCILQFLCLLCVYGRGSVVWKGALGSPSPTSFLEAGLLPRLCLAVSWKVSWKRGVYSLCRHPVSVLYFQCFTYNLFQCFLLKEELLLTYSLSLPSYICDHCPIQYCPGAPGRVGICDLCCYPTSSGVLWLSSFFAFSFLG